MSVNVPCPIVRCSFCEKRMNLWSMDPSRRCRVRHRAQEGAPVFCQRRCWYGWFRLHEDFRGPNRQRARGARGRFAATGQA